MTQTKPKQIQVTIYPNQLQWMDLISKTLNRSRRETFLECFACYIGELKKSLRKGEHNNVS